MHRERTLTTSEIADMVDRLGGRVEQRGNHKRLLDRQRRLCSVLPCSGSLNGRLYKNIRCQLKRAGMWDPAVVRVRRSKLPA